MKHRICIIIALAILACAPALAQTSNTTSEGIKKLEARELKEAIKLFEQALDQDSKDQVALSGIIKAHLLSENLRDAQRYIEMAIQEFPSSPEYYLHQGIFNNKRAQYRRAIEDFNKALELSGDNIDIQIYINRGVSHMQDENYGDAIADFTDALKINPRHASALNYRAFANYRIQNYNESINDYNKVLDLDPNNAMGYYNRGMSHLRSGNKAKACPDFHQACSRGNRNACRMIVTECSGSR
jgi:tetratricopeptide (TPR) repeat protein